jgi:pyrroline-5-carboxylate reductase
MSAGSLRPVAFVGGGQMALALAEGFGRGGLIAAAEIAVHDPAPEATARFAARVPGVRVASDNAAAVRGAPLVFLAVKPQHAEAACREAAGALAADATVVSIVAGVPIATLAAWLGSSRIVRVMPNTPCLIGKGVSAVSRSASVPAAAAAEVARLLTTVGSVHDVDERLLDAVTGLSGSGPGFVTLLIEGLIDGGVKAGLPRALARELALGTVAGTAALVAESGEHPAVIRDRVTSPAGTTIAGLAVLERRATRGALVDAVVAATDRAAELGRGSASG